MSDENKKTLNGQEMTESDFNKKKEELEKKPGVTVVQVTETEHKTRIKG